nr:hypothetical protein [Candidatus Poriferisodalis multihospitum]
MDPAEGILVATETRADGRTAPGLQEGSQAFLDLLAVLGDANDMSGVAYPEHDETAVGVRERTDRLSDFVPVPEVRLELGELVFADSDPIENVGPLHSCCPKLLRSRI